MKEITYRLLMNQEAIRKRFDAKYTGIIIMIKGVAIYQYCI